MTTTPPTSAPGPSEHDPRHDRTAGPLRVDIASHEARLYGHTAVLTARELDVLVHLIDQQGRVRSIDEISAAVWGHPQDTNSVAVHVKRLRAKLPLENARGGPLIWNVRGVGYRLAPALSTDAPPAAAPPVPALVTPDPLRTFPAESPETTRQVHDSSVIIESMNTEQLVSVQRRAAMHAALADASRLRIVDHLTLGDASPSELQAALSMPSNLVAHHLKVLQEAGLVHRDVSHADRRRTYVRLSASGLADLLPRPHSRASRVIFVCTQNSARSQLATALWEQRSSIPSTSAGTHPAPQINPGALAAAKRHRLAMPEREPQHLDDVLRQGDLVVVVCDNAHEHLPAELQRLHWSVPDPVASTRADAFDTAIVELADRIDGLVHAVIT